MGSDWARRWVYGDCTGKAGSGQNCGTRLVWTLLLLVPAFSVNEGAITGVDTPG